MGGLLEVWQVPSVTKVVLNPSFLLPVMRVIAHVDMDAFFASVELLDHPEYQGLPLIIGSDPKEGKGRGVVSTCSYEARALGVHSAMPISQAYRLAPNAIYLPVKMERYVQASEEVMDVLEEFSPYIERASIDEAYIDLSDMLEDEDLETMAYMLQNRVKKSTGLSCSVGIGSNKCVAKIASSIRKPGGVMVVEDGDAASFLAPLDVGAIPGVGEKTQGELASMGINTIGDLASYPADVLKKKMGVWGERMWALAHGWDNSPVEERTSISSIGREHTFDEDTLDRVKINSILRRLVLESLKDLSGQGLAYRTVVLKIRFSDFKTITRSRTYPHPMATSDGIWAALSILTPEIFSQKEKRVRLLGVRLSGIDRFAGQTTLDYWLHVSDRDARSSASRVK